MAQNTSPSRVQRVIAVAAALFGIATLVAGGRILLGFGEAGYAVVRWVLVFNTLMGVLYLATALVVARDLQRGVWLAGLIALANLMVLGAILVRRATGGAVARETLAAMALRTGVWILIAVILGRERKRRDASPRA